MVWPILSVTVRLHSRTSGVWDLERRRAEADEMLGWVALLIQRAERQGSCPLWLAAGDSAVIVSRGMSSLLVSMIGDVQSCRCR